MKSNNIKLSLKNINFLVEQLLQEQVFGNLAYVYHGSNAPPDVMLDLIKNKKFIPGHGSGAMYGPGLYTVREFNLGTHTFDGYYGKYVYKFKTNLAGVVSFDSDVTQQIYGKSISIRDQIKLIINKNLVGSGSIEELKKFLKSNQNNDLDKLSYDFDFSSGAAVSSWRSLIKFVKGISFTGISDGPVIVFYSLDGIIPVAWSKTGEETQKDFKWNRFEADSQKQNYDYEQFDQIKNDYSKLNDLINNFHKSNVQKIFLDIFKNKKGPKINKIKEIFLTKIEKIPKEFFEPLIEDANENIKILIAQHNDTSSQILEKLIKDSNENIKEYILSNPNCSPDILEKFSKNSNRILKSTAIQNSNFPLDILEKLSENINDNDICYAIAKNSNATLKCLENISKSKERKIKLLVIEHHNTSIGILENLSKDEDLFVANAAKEILEKRKSGIKLSLRKKIKEILNNDFKLKNNNKTLF